jgi:hypothetical protein
MSFLPCTSGFDTFLSKKKFKDASELFELDEYVLSDYHYSSRNHFVYVFVYVKNWTTRWYLPLDSQWLTPLLLVKQV